LDLVLGKELGEGDLGLVEVEVGGLDRVAGPPVNDLVAKVGRRCRERGGVAGGSEVIAYRQVDRVPETGSAGAPSAGSALSRCSMPLAATRTLFRQLERDGCRRKMASSQPSRTARIASPAAGNHQR
jgi:hypothetical protein